MLVLHSNLWASPDAHFQCQNLFLDRESRGVTEGSMWRGLNVWSRKLCRGWEDVRWALERPGVAGWASKENKARTTTRLDWIACGTSRSRPLVWRVFSGFQGAAHRGNGAQLDKPNFARRKQGKIYLLELNLKIIYALEEGLLGIIQIYQAKKTFLNIKTKHTKTTCHLSFPPSLSHKVSIFEWTRNGVWRPPEHNSATIAPSHPQELSWKGRKWLSCFLPCLPLNATLRRVPKFENLSTGKTNFWCVLSPAITEKIIKNMMLLKI